MPPVSQEATYAPVAGTKDQTFVAWFIPAGEDWVEVDVTDEIVCAPKAEIAPFVISVRSGSLATVKVTGLPSGLKFTAKAMDVKATKTTAAAHYEANTIYGTPTKGGIYVATVTATTAGKKSATETVKFVVRGDGESIVDVGWDATQGKVTGAGVYAEGKKATLKATANKGYVFMGWYESGNLVSRLASYSLTMPGHDVSFEAYFISSEEDRAAISASVGGEFGFDADNLTAEKTVSAGVYLEWPVVAEALSATTVKVAGLPNGLKFTAKDIVDSKTKEVIVPANTIYGTPSAASKVDKSGKVTPSAVKITVTTAGKNSQTFQIDTTVVALPERVVGTFTGGSDGETSGSAFLTVAAGGKISGKWISDGKTWTLAANGFTIGDPDCCQFETTLTAKYGKETREISLAVTTDGAASTDLFTAYWANWKVEPWKTIGKAMTNKGCAFYVSEDGGVTEDELVSSYGTVTLSTSANGTVKTTGAFVTGKNGAKDVVYKASGSTILIPIEEGKYYAFVYFPPSGAFAGYAKNLTLNWDGAAFSMQVARADCWKRAATITTGQTKSIALVNEYDPDLREYLDAGVYYLTFTAKRGQAYSVRVYDADEDVDVSIDDIRAFSDLERYWDIYAPYFDREKRTSTGLYHVLFADAWDNGSPESVRYYICLHGEPGQKAKVQLLPYAYERPYYTVTFKANGGQWLWWEDEREVVGVGFQDGDMIEMPGVQRMGYHFDGWYTDPSGGERIEDGLVVYSPMSLYAHWSDATFYSVTFDSCGGGCSENERFVESGYEVGVLPIPTREGCRFEGWYSAKTDGDVVSADTRVVSDMTLYARWYEIPYCVVAFNPNGGSCLENERLVESGFEVGRLPVPGREGYLFVGWYTGLENGEKVTLTTSIESDIELYAHWVACSGTDDLSVECLVVDIGERQAAKSYSLYALDDVPTSGWSEEFKSNYLVLRRIEGDERVVTNAFYVGIFEVTQRQWELVMGTRPSYFSNNEYYETRPVEQISMDDAESFIAALRDKTGLNFSLPTEVQWEYACRAGTTTAFNDGSNKMTAVGRYWHNGGKAGASNALVDVSKGTATVGSYVPNAWGLYDMHGNVSEWCQGKVSRGGSWHWDYKWCTATYRIKGEWSEESSNATFKGGYGLRLFATIEE